MIPFFILAYPTISGFDADCGHTLPSPLKTSLHLSPLNMAFPLSQLFFQIHGYCSAVTVKAFDDRMKWDLGNVHDRYFFVYISRLQQRSEILA